MAGAIILDNSNKSKESEAQPVNEIIPANLNYKHSMGSVSFGAQNRLTFEDTSGFDKAANDIYEDNDDSGSFSQNKRKKTQKNIYSVIYVSS